MGDSRILITIVGDSLTNPPLAAGGDPEETIAFAHRLSADSTLRDAVDLVLSDLAAPSSAAGGHSLFRFGDVAAASSNGERIDDDDGGGGDRNTTVRLAAYDTTYHPPRDITSEIVTRGSARSGPQSVTLQGMGWFPSGRIAVCRADDAASRTLIADGGLAAAAHLMDENFEYNLPSTTTDNANGGAPGEGVRLRAGVIGALNGADGGVAAGKPRPSEIFESVRSRFDGDRGKDTAAAAAAAASPAARTRRRRTESERTARIDSYIRSLDEKTRRRQQQQQGGGSNGKKKTKSDGVSGQVRRMLIKSRAEGDDRLREEDRFYLEIIVVDETCPSGGEWKREEEEGNGADGNGAGGEATFRYFSRLANAGRVASAMSPSRDGDCTVELLVVRQRCGSSSSDGGNGGDETSPPVVSPPTELVTCYRRLPNMMALHEAEAGGYLSQFDRVVVRAYRIAKGGGDGTAAAASAADGSHTTHSASLSVLDDDGGENDDEDADDKVDADHEMSKEQQEDVIMSDDVPSDAPMKEEGERTFTEEMDLRRITAAIEMMDEESSKGKKKKKKKEKKKSAASDKVRQMVMKSKAQGDKKRVKDTDRFHLEVVVVDDAGTEASGKCEAKSSSYRFFNRMADVGQIITHVAPSGSAPIKRRPEVLAEGKDGVFRRLCDSTRLCDVEDLEPYQRVVIRRFV